MAKDLKQASIDYLVYVLQHLGWSANKLAQEAGIASSTLTRAVAKTGSGLSMKTIEKIRNATGVDPSLFISDEGPFEDRALRRPYPTRRMAGSGVDYRAAWEGIPVLDEIAIGVWREEADRAPIYTIPLQSTNSSLYKKLRGYIIRDHSVLRIADANSVLIVEPIYLTKREPNDGDLVIVHRIRVGESAIEVTARRLYLKDDGTPELWFEAVDDSLRGLKRVVELNNPPKGEELRIVGVVRYVLSLPAPSVLSAPVF